MPPLVTSAILQHVLSIPVPPASESPCREGEQNNSCRLQKTQSRRENSELGIVRVVAVAFRQRARCGTQLEFLYPTAPAIGAGLLLCDFLRFPGRQTEEQINVGIRKQPAASETSSGNEREAARSKFVRGNELAPKRLRISFDEKRSLGDGRFDRFRLAAKSRAIRSARRRHNFAVH